LRSSSVPGPLQQLWQDLRRALVLAGQGRHVARSFTPHVTVAYSHAALLDVMPIEPVAWRVERVALVHSVVGQQDYRVLAEWSLQAVA
ncbi:RNA 2',3'-cyclic phosphodiesterase, partial [Rhodanobacter denitrificans]|nr:RNA 2',3'-cyclic phosphodiesterase [Rhodanobacter denitrificans]